MLASEEKAFSSDKVYVDVLACVCARARVRAHTQTESERAREREREREVYHDVLARFTDTLRRVLTSQLRAVYRTYAAYIYMYMIFM